MQKLDRLGWAAGVCVEAYGVRIGVRVTAPDVPADVRACLPPGCRPAGSPFVDHLFSLRLGGPGPRPGSRSYYLLHAGLELIARTADRAEALAALENALQATVAAHARGRVFVHAGVVGWRGRAIVLPGRPLPVGLIAFTEYRPGARWRPAPLSPARALFELAANTYPEVAQSRLGQETLERLAVAAPAVFGRRGDADELATHLLSAAAKSPAGRLPHVGQTARLPRAA